MHFRIVSPSACVDVENIQSAKMQLEQLGHTVSLAEHVFSQHRYLAGTVEQRIIDLKHACLDDHVDAIWCGRGGTGAAMLLPYLGEWILNKPILGYSDSTVLLNYVAMQGGKAIHAPVFQEIAVKNLIDNQSISTDALKTIQLLHADAQKQHYQLMPLNECAETQRIEDAWILGGNLTVLCTLQGTSYDLALKQSSVLLIEDVGEPFYRIERSFTQLLQSIDLKKLSAIILGDFYHCPQKNVPHSIIEIIKEHVDPLEIPLYQGEWFGHGQINQPFWIGKQGKIADSTLII